MEPNNIIAAFLQVVDQQAYIFDKDSLEDLYTIKQTLIKLENQPLQAAADAITNWCQKHEVVSNAVRFMAREFEIKPSLNQANQQTTFTNQSTRYKEIIDNRIKNQLSDSQQTQSTQN